MKLIFVFLIIFVTLKIGECDESKSKSEPEKSNNSLSSNSSDDLDNLAHPDDLIKAELVALIGEVDSDEDGELDLIELTRWVRKAHNQAQKRTVDVEWARLKPIEREEHTWTDYEPTHRQYLLWKQYLNKIEEDWRQLDTKGEQKDKLIKRYENRWKAADEDGDSQLSRTEFHFFLHPENSKNETVRQVLVLELKEDLDLNQDGVVSLDEYMRHMITAHESELGEHKESLAERSSFENDHRNHFEMQLDEDKNGALSDDELSKWLAIDLDRHQMEAERLMQLADQDHDQKLEVPEIMIQSEHFYDLLPPEFWDRLIPEQENDLDHDQTVRHDEF